MTTEPAQDGELPRRKFDDIASLYRPVGASNGASTAFPQHRPAFIPLPPTYTAPVRQPEPAPPKATAPVSVAETAPTTTPLEIVPVAPAQTRIEPTVSAPRPASTPAPRARPNEIPWPDAFQPRPNYRKPQRSKLAWLLLIPAGLIAAAAITMVDPRSIRSWVDINLLHRAPTAGTLDSPLLPDAFRKSGAATPQPAATQKSSAATPSSMNDPAPSAAEQVQTPALALSAPGTVAPAPTAAAAATPIHIGIQFRRNIPGADGEARRIAALLQSSGGSIELHPNVATVRAATINYYNPADKDAASALATVLANEAPSWLVRLGTTKNPPGTIDVWLP